MFPQNSVEEMLRNAAGLPEGVRVAMFGSTAESPAAESDIDLLFLYDSDRIDSSDIYARLEPFFREVERVVGRTVHPVVLSFREEKEVGFFQNEGCVAVARKSRD